jgi:hypothetical protein
MVALISKYAIDIQIGGGLQPTYLEFEPDSRDDLDTPEELQRST